MANPTTRRLTALVLLERDAIDALERRMNEGDPRPAGGGASGADRAAGEVSRDFEIRIVRGRAPEGAVEVAAREPWCADYLAGAIAAHAEHLAIAVAVAPGACPVAAATWLGVRVHAVLRTYAAAVVVWGETKATPAGLFAERWEAYQGASPGERELPVELWIDSGLARVGGAVSARTRGLAPLDRPEVELAPVPADLEDARELVLELALHLVESAPHAWPADGSIAGELGGAELAVRRTDGTLALAPVAVGVPRTRPSAKPAR